MVTTTRYLYFGNQYVGETDENGTLKRRYVNEPDTYTHLIAQHEVSSGGNRYYHYDAIGSTRQVTDETETVTDEFTYDAWGNRLSRSGTSEIPFQYVGQSGYYRDENVESYYIMERIYNPKTNRWLSIDPLRRGILYMYADARPIVHTDPSGLITIKAVDEIPFPLEKDEKCPATSGTLTDIAWEFLVLGPISAKSGEHLGAPCDGFIVQEIKITCHHNDCTKCPPKGIPKKPDYVFYEAWFIKARQTKPTNIDPNRKPIPYTDHSSITHYAGHCGYRRAEGDVRFFCMGRPEVGDLRKKWLNPLPLYGKNEGLASICFSVGNKLSTQEKPEFWDNYNDGPAKRFHSVEYTCCPCEPEDVDIDADPRKNK